MKDSEIKKHLEINKQRQEIIDALLIARDHSDAIQTIKALSKDARAEIIEKFKFSPLQAQAIIDIKKPIFLIPEENITGEKNNLRTIEAELKSSLSRKWIFKRANLITYLKSIIDRIFKKHS